MPSDATAVRSEETVGSSKTEAILAVFQEQANAFRSALALTVEEVRSALSAGPEGDHDDVTQAAELGRFGSGRIDASRFNALLDQTLTLDPDDAAHMKAAFESLQALSNRSEGLFALQLPPRACLHDLVAGALADIGRAFGAARVVQASRSGRYDESKHAGLLEGLPFRRWNQAERALCPPLVVEVEGGDLQAGGLSEFLDGRAKIVLVVQGEAPAAPLTRLITPNTFVIQATQSRQLEALAAHDGPRIAALMPDSAARFTHAPKPASSLRDRLRVAFVPEEAPRALAGGLSAAQQAEDLAQLKTLIEEGDRPAGAEPRAPLGKAAAAATPQSPASADDPAGKLAAWLLAQAERA